MSFSSRLASRLGLDEVDPSSHADYNSYEKYYFGKDDLQKITDQFKQDETDYTIEYHNQLGMRWFTMDADIGGSVVRIIIDLP